MTDEQEAKARQATAVGSAYLAAALIVLLVITEHPNDEVGSEWALLILFVTGIPIVGWMAWVGDQIQQAEKSPAPPDEW